MTRVEPTRNRVILIENEATIASTYHVRTLVKKNSMCIAEENRDIDIFQKKNFLHSRKFAVMASCNHALGLKPSAIFSASVHVSLL